MCCNFFNVPQNLTCLVKISASCLQTHTLWIKQTDISLCMYVSVGHVLSVQVQSLITLWHQYEEFPGLCKFFNTTQWNRNEKNKHWGTDYPPGDELD